MQFKINFYRVMAIPACLVWGILEMIALQRSRFAKSALVVTGVSKFTNSLR
jgi:hypothetical protein